MPFDGKPKVIRGKNRGQKKNCVVSRIQATILNYDRCQFPQWFGPVQSVNFWGLWLLAFITRGMNVRKVGIPVYVFCSRQSARQFIRLFAGIQATPYWFHQTLTFGEPKPDLRLAHARLKILLDRLEKTHPGMSCFWVREQEKDSGYHFHVIFVFFGSQPLEPEPMRQKFGKAVFAKWNDINGGGLFRNASLMTLRAKDDRCILYFTEWVKISPQTKRFVHWNGQRRISKHSMPAPKQEVKRLLKICFDDRNRPQKPASEPPRFYGKLELKREKAYINARNILDWQTHKRIITKRKGKVTDDAYMKFQNELTGAKPPPSKRHPPIIFVEPANWKFDPDDTL
jgi:hypothetical protein